MVHALPKGLKGPALADNPAGRGEAASIGAVPNLLSLVPLGRWGQSHPAGVGDPKGISGL